MTVVAVVGVLLALLVAGLCAYGRWAGWGFGLRWWGQTTPARVVSVEPLRGALMKGGAVWALTEARHRIRATLEVQPRGGEPYRATAITWVEPNQSLAGRDVTVRVSRTRPARVLLPRGADAPVPEDPTAGRY